MYVFDSCMFWDIFVWVCLNIVHNHLVFLNIVHIFVWVCLNIEYVWICLNMFESLCVWAISSYQENMCCGKSHLLWSSMARWPTRATTPWWTTSMLVQVCPPRIGTPISAPLSGFVNGSRQALPQYARQWFLPQMPPCSHSMRFHWQCQKPKGWVLVALYIVLIII